MSDRNRATLFSFINMIMIALMGISFMFYFLDIGARREAQVAERFRQAISHCMNLADISYWQWDITNGEVYWSDNLREVYGVPGSNLASYDDWLSILHPDDREEADRICSVAVEERSSYRMEYRVIDSTGQPRTIFEIGTMTPDGKYMLGICIGSNHFDFERLNRFQQTRGNE